jgi:hypothetical protein
MAIRQITKEEFDGFPVQRVPLVGVTWNEEEFHRDDAGNVLGVVLHVVGDDDWAWAILGRDEHGDFRAFSNEVCLPTRAAARVQLIQHMEAAESTGAVVFPQGT